MRAVVQQEVEHEQSVARGGHLQGAHSVTEFTTCRPYTQVELVALGKQL